MGESLGIRSLLRLIPEVGPLLTGQRQSDGAEANPLQGGAGRVLGGQESKEMSLQWPCVQESDVHGLRHQVRQFGALAVLTKPEGDHGRLGGEAGQRLAICFYAAQVVMQRVQVQASE